MGKISEGLAWDDSFKLGHHRVDMQHRRLFELLSEVINSCITNGTDTAKVKEALDFLVTYTVQHFDDEEALQLEHSFPGYEKHKQLHEDFKTTVGELVQKFTETGSSEELGSELNRVVVKWLLGHIQNEDQKIGAHMRQIGAS